MPTYEYECDACKRAFEFEQKISDPPLQRCPLPDPRTVDERQKSFDSAGGAMSWNYRSFAIHPDRCVCQGTDSTPHRHYEEDHSCARCIKCTKYQPQISEPSCDGPVQRLISGSTSFVLKGTGWFKDGY
jgi:putative FmdB family regulatory protein